ncbi:50S ribosomal protein L3 [Candidatus Cyrtobacter comes]|uniref:50S ribosomal protein L3 n=1 Tax=Candidatus Cyrtobacter comes TaxID=675776 RepID=A0ABU5L6P3_9RICK|nr:50S ribosomal protein L3 [Candidatus Cyrtobacter comes]MDZ5761722.1 50S ribosomal protein L3 [Candidatus Cyrtobacter comes]
MANIGCPVEKLGMSQVFSNDGSSIPVTVLRVLDSEICSMKTHEKHGYSAAVLKYKFGKKLKLKELRFLSNLHSYKVGDKVDASSFKGCSFIDVSGSSIGKGFAGSMKRHNFAGLEASHGVSVSHRSHGSTGNRAYPGRVFKGKKMSGHMGDRNVTSQNLSVFEIDEELGLLVVMGSVPGHRHSLLFVTDSVKKPFLNA